MAEQAACIVCSNVLPLEKLECGHSICFENCLGKIKEGKKQIQCPVCRQAYKVVGAKLERIETCTTEDLHEHNPRECLIHKQEKTYYCKKCKVSICSDCFIEGHNGHDYSKDVSNEMKKDIESLLKSTKSDITQAKDHFEYMKNVEQAIMARPEKLKAEINDWFNPLIKSLEKQRDDLLGEAEEGCNNDIKEIYKKRDKLEKAINDYEKGADDARALLGTTDEQRILLDGQTIINNLQQISNLSVKRKDTEELETKIREFKPGVRPKISADSKVERSCLTPGIRIECSGPPGNVPLHDTVTFEANLSLVINGEKLQRDPTCKPSVRITHGQKQKDIPTPPTVQKDGGKWQVSFKPVVAGHHQIYVTAETEFAGKPLNSEPKEDWIKVNPKNSIHSGDRVEQGPDWAYEQDSQLKGEVIRNMVESGELKVRWENGIEGCYRWGQEGEYQVQRVEQSDTT